MTEVIWKEPAISFLRKLDKQEAERIVKKIDKEIKNNPLRYIKELVYADFGRIRIGDYRLFTDYEQIKDKLIINTIKHRKNAYKK